MKFAMYYGFSERLKSQGCREAVDEAKKLGFSAVELLADLISENPDNPVKDVLEARQLKALLEQEGLSVCCYSVCVNLWKNPGAEQAMYRQIEIAAELGSPYVHHTLLPWLTLPEHAPGYNEAVGEITESAARIADYAKSFGIRCIYEDQGFYFNGIEGFGGFFREMKKRCRNIGICADLGNILFVREKPEDFLMAFGQDVCHVHVKDYLYKQTMTAPGKYWLKTDADSWLRDTMIGDGIVDFEQCMKVLKNRNYTGYFSLENTHPEPYEEGVLQAMEYLRRFW